MFFILIVSGASLVYSTVVQTFGTDSVKLFACLKDFLLFSNCVVWIAFSKKEGLRGASWIFPVLGFLILCICNGLNLFINRQVHSLQSMVSLRNMAQIEQTVTFGMFVYALNFDYRIAMFVFTPFYVGSTFLGEFCTIRKFK